ncbi:MAG: type II toxin-antitoxin system VapC family toxin [Acidimicrobiales bacterium]
MTALVVDTSAAVAILTSEPDADHLIERLSSATSLLMSTATLLELSIVMEARLGPASQGIVERFIRDSELELVPVHRSHVDRALEGWRRFGNGRHKAAVNFGDCFSYALSVATGHPLLYVGDDFPLTDVPMADDERT